MKQDRLLFWRNLWTRLFLTFTGWFIGTLPEYIAANKSLYVSKMVSLWYKTKDGNITEQWIEVYKLTEQGMDEWLS